MSQHKTQLTREDFFFVPERSYDRWAEKAILSYDDVQDAVVRSLPFKMTDAVRIADVGAGSGVTSAAILRKFLRAEVIVVELFEELLLAAKHRLEEFKGRVTLVHAD